MGRRDRYRPVGRHARCRTRAGAGDSVRGRLDTQLAVIDSAWSGAIALYSIIHFTPDERATACREFARTVRPGDWLLLAFHIDSPEFAVGTVNHTTSWFGQAVRIDGYFLEPDAVISDVEAAGFTVMSTTIRKPFSEAEYPSRRCYLISRRH